MQNATEAVIGRRSHAEQTSNVMEREISDLGYNLYCKHINDVMEDRSSEREFGKYKRQKSI